MSREPGAAGANGGGVVARALLFFLASNAAVLFVLKFGLWLWPDRLPANSQNMFWLASGVNVAGLLLLGVRYWPVLLLNAFPAWRFAGEPLPLTALGSVTNAVEALLAAGIILRLGAFAGNFDSVRSVLALLTASVAAPLVNTLVIPAYLCATGVLRWEHYGEALGNWNLANGAAMLFLVPLLPAFRRAGWSVRGRAWEFACLLVAAIVLGIVAFQAVFAGAATNFAFVVFPIVIYAAVRFGQAETSLVLLVVLAGIYGSFGQYAGRLPPGETASVVWFVQAFCWVLAATGLVVAALSAERRRAENHSLEVSLSEERARLDALRYQVNPHFLFNALNSVRSTLPLSEQVGRDMITDIAGYLRSTLSREGADVVPLKDEVRLAANYLGIERRRFGERLEVLIEIEPPAGEISVPVFMVQPLVENAIRHGLENSWAPCRITIRAAVVEKRLRLEVSNTGQWRAPGERPGVGLANVRRRLQLLYRAAASLEIFAVDGQVRILIEIPV